MTTLENRPGSALVVIDMQVDVLAPAHERDAVVGRISALVDRARREGVPIVWVQHSAKGLPIDSDGWQFVPELSPGSDEPIVHKVHGDSFEGTDMDDRLAELGVGRLVVTGAQTDACVRSTIHGAFARGYDVTLVSDAHTTEDLTEFGAPSPADVIAHTNLYWEFQSGPGKTAEVATAAEVSLAGA